MGDKSMNNKIVRTSLGLRDMLFDELDALREGKTNPQRASAVAKLAVQIINSVRIEIDHQRHVLSVMDAGSKVTPSAALQLGSDVCAQA
jgi:hypothetical protein